VDPEAIVAGYIAVVCVDVLTLVILLVTEDMEGFLHGELHGHRTECVGSILAH
jgi:hypothetical protein